MTVQMAPVYLPLLLFLVAVGSGLWVSRSGAPYPVLLFNFHKLAALAGVVLAVVRIGSGAVLEHPSGWIAAAVVVMGICVLVLFATGAVMSVKAEGSGLVLFLHRAGPVIITLCLAGILLSVSVAF